MTWEKIIVEALESLGGEAQLHDIYEYARLNYPSKIHETFSDSIRTAIYGASSDSEYFKNGDDLFYAAGGVGNGIWGINEYDIKKVEPNLTSEDAKFKEGKSSLRKHILKERNPNLSRLAKKNFIKDHNGKLFCEVCFFNFEEKYGEIGADFIEAHHIKPLSELNDEGETTIHDLAMVCSNCHSMLHRKKPSLKKNELQKIIEKQSSR